MVGTRCYVPFVWVTGMTASAPRSEAGQPRTQVAAPYKAPIGRRLAGFGHDCHVVVGVVAVDRPQLRDRIDTEQVQLPRDHQRTDCECGYPASSARTARIWSITLRSVSAGRLRGARLSLVIMPMVRGRLV